MKTFINFQVLSFFMKFIFLLKNALNLTRKRKKARFAWTLDENKYLTIDEVKKLRRYCCKKKRQALKENKITGVRNWFMVELGLNAGLRVKEMANLKCGDILIDKEHSSIIALGKRGKKRSVWISSKFKKDCLWFLKWKQKVGQSTKPESYIFTSENGNQLTRRALQKAFYSTIKKAGLSNHSIHHLRHTFGSYLYLSSGHNLRLVQEQLGHSSVKVTEVYASVMNTDAKNAVENLYK